MTDPSFTTTVLVEATPAEAYAAINDVRGWWSQDVEGDTDTVGAQFAFRGNDRGENVHRSRIEVTELVPGERVVWHVLDNWMGFVEDQSEWKDTRIVFEISPTADGTRDPLQPPGSGAHLRVLRPVLPRLDVLPPGEPARADQHRPRRPGPTARDRLTSPASGELARSPRRDSRVSAVGATLGR